MMSARITRHLIKRLRHEAGMQALAAAIEDGILAPANSTPNDQDDVDSPGEYFFDTRFSVDIEEDVVGEHRLPVARGSSRNLALGPLLAGRAASTVAQILRRRTGVELHGADCRHEGTIVDAFLAAARTPRPDDLACMLLVASAIRTKGLTDEKVLSALAAPQPVICIHGQVAGFEKKLVRLMDRGLLSFGPVKILRATDEPLYALHGRNGDTGSPVFALFGSRLEEEDETAVDKLVQRLSRHGLPILCVSESETGIPASLRVAACLDLVTGPLTPDIVVQVIAEVLGEPASDERSTPDPDTVYWEDRARDLLEPDCGLLTLGDLALAVRPRIGRDRALEILLAQGALRRSMAMRKANNQSGSGAASGSSSSGRQGRFRNGDAGSGCEVVQPATSSPRSDPTAPTIEKMHGYGKARAWGLDLQADLALWREGKLAWDQMSAKLLLSGPPGTGKTTYARALCNTLGVPLVLASVSTWLEPGYLGDVIKRIRLSFEEAAKLRPAILFVDELDGIGSRGRSRDHDDYWRSLINKLLELLDGALRSEGVIVVGATNDPHHIDPALRRSGRLETHIEIPLPDVDALVGIIEHHLGDDRTAVIVSKPINVPNDADADAASGMGRGADGLVGETPGRRTAGAGEGRA